MCAVIVVVAMAGVLFSVDDLVSPNPVLSITRTTGVWPPSGNK